MNPFVASLIGLAALPALAFAQPLPMFERHQDNVYSVSVSSDGKYVLTASGDGTAGYWELGQPKKKWSLEHEAPVYQAIFSPFGD